MQRKKKETGKLVATRPVLFDGKSFKTGQELPEGTEMEAVWLKSGAAVRAAKEATEETAEKTEE